EENSPPRPQGALPSRFPSHSELSFRVPLRVSKTFPAHCSHCRRQPRTYALKLPTWSGPSYSEEKVCSRQHPSVSTSVVCEAENVLPEQTLSSEYDGPDQVGRKS